MGRINSQGIIEDISKYRTEIMGVATILVVLYHIVPKGIKFIYLLPLQMGCIGVDLFLLVSGFGLYCSYSNNSATLLFYKKRFLRTWLPFIISTAVVAVIYGKSLSGFLCESSTINYFVGKSFWLWYMPCIFVLYLIFPILYHTVRRYGGYMLLLAYTISFLLSFIFVHSELGDLRFQYINFTARIPIFCIGIYLAYMKESKSNICLPPYVIVFSAVALATCWFWFRNLNIFVVYLSSLGILSLVFVRIIAKILSVSSKTVKWGGVFGSMSLEVYLIHQYPLEFLKQERLFYLIPIAMILVFITAHYFSKLNQYLCKRLNN